MSEVPFLRPPLDMQHRIAAVLGKLDDKIELRELAAEPAESAEDRAVVGIGEVHRFRRFRGFRKTTGSGG